MTLPERVPLGEPDQYPLLTWTEIGNVMAMMGVDSKKPFPAVSRTLVFGHPDDKAEIVSALLTLIWTQYTVGYTNDNGERVVPLGWLSLPWEVRDFYIRASFCEGVTPLSWPRDKDPRTRNR